MEELVPFPDRIERSIEIAHPPATVWAALTTAEGISSWFGKDAEIDLRPGGSARVTGDSGRTYHIRVERAEEPIVFAFTWPIHGQPEDDPRRTGRLERELDVGAAGVVLGLPVDGPGEAEHPRLLHPFHPQVVGAAAVPGHPG